jgi:pimeloyl-ACP methyl ester carboxylesterase
MASDRYNAYIDGPWGQIHVRVAGEGNPVTILLLHKMVWSSVIFKNAQPALAARSIRSIAVDMPGYGLSDKPDRLPTVADYAASLLPILDHFGLTSVHLLGDHTGAAFAAAFCDLYPDRAESLILDGPPIFDAGTRRKLLAKPPYDGALAKDAAHFVRRWRTVESSLPGPISTEALHDAVTQFFLAGPKEYYGHDAIFRYDLTAVLKRLTLPVLIMTNPGDTLYQLAKDVMILRPDFVFWDIDWPGSQNVYDNPEPWSDAVADFLLSGVSE